MVLMMMVVDSLPGQAAEPAGSGHGGDGDSDRRRERSAQGRDAHRHRQPDAEDCVQPQRQRLLS